MAAATTTSSSHWKDLVRVSGSFYCNLSSTSEELECTPAEDNNRTVLKVPGAPDHSPHLDRDSNTIKLVIGGSTSTPSEPLSLDTSEYVSWDGGSILAGHQTPEGEEGEDVSSTPPATTPRIVGLEDELTHTCRQYFDHRQHKLLLLQRSGSQSKGVVTTKGDGRVPAPIRPSSATPKQPGLQDKMEHLRREIVSLVNQDDALFRQLLALNTSIHQLRSQSLQRRVRTLSGGRSRSNGGNQLSPSPSAASLTSLTSLSDEEDEEDEVRVTATEVMSTAAPLTRQRVSYPPKARSSQGASSSGLSRNSFNSSSSSTSSNNSSSSYSPTWSVSSAGSSGSSSISAAVNKNVSILNTNSKTPRSPHSSFYCRTGRSTSSGSASLQHQRNSHHGDYRSISNGDLLMVIHKRQGSYDSGIQGSEPSDAEVFV